ncbi:4976_t:CDS:2 [Entrophospora sp. SA101]|nr:4976_t:CDS:2 [Entrophospora sp. SA101]
MARFNNAERLKRSAVENSAIFVRLRGIIGGETFGVARKSRLISVKVLNSFGNGRVSEVIAGIAFVLNKHKTSRNKNTVVNMSFGGDTSEALNYAVRLLTNAGIHVVAAAGNDGDDACDVSPASAQSAITVGAIEHRKNIKADFSNFGRCVDIFAPGVDIISASSESNTGRINMIANTTITKVPSNLFEELINEKQLNLYEYEQFNKIKEISIKEKCNKIYKAIWKLNNVIVTLKELMVDVTFQENRSILHSFIDELKLHKKLDFHSNILKFYGITKGKIKFSIFGLSLQSTSDIKGDMTYIGPQCYEKNNKKSDIYNLGFLLWEISSGKTPSRNLYLPSNNNTSSFSSSIIQESSAKGTPQSYIDVYKNCWNDDPDKRPDINEIEKLLAQHRRSSFNVTKFHQIPQSPTKLNSSNNSIESNKKIIADTDSTFFENLLKFFIELLELSGDNNYIISSLKGFLHNHMREHKSTFKSLLKNYNDDSDFNFIIGFFYENSIGTVQDKQLAFEHYEKSAKTGNSIGQYFLGRCYYWGFGIKVDRKSRLISVKVLNSFGNGRVSEVIAGIAFVLNKHKTSRNKNTVVNMSFGGDTSEALNYAVRLLTNAGIHVVAAAGNDGDDACDVSPASAQSAITVGAIEHRKNIKADFSNFGRCVDIFAPGVDIISASSESNTGRVIFSGTSQAAPHITGTIALIIGEFGNSHPSKMAEKLIYTSTKNVINDLSHDTPNRLVLVPN